MAVEYDRKFCGALNNKRTRQGAPAVKQLFIYDAKAGTESPMPAFATSTFLLGYLPDAYSKNFLNLAMIFHLRLLIVCCETPTV